MRNCKQTASLCNCDLKKACQKCWPFSVNLNSKNILEVDKNAKNVFACIW